MIPSGGMETGVVEDLMADLRQVKVRTRRDRRATSVPLVAFGVLTVGYAFVNNAKPALAGGLYWIIAAPAGFAFVAWYHRRHEVNTGVGARSGAYRTGTIVTAVLGLLVGPVLIFFGGSFVFVGFALASIALQQRNLYLGLCALGYGILGRCWRSTFCPTGSTSSLTQSGSTGTSMATSPGQTRSRPASLGCS